MKTITSLVLILGTSYAYRLKLRDEPSTEASEDSAPATTTPAVSGPTDQFTQSFTELETGIAQGNRNVSQGALGR